MWAAHTGGQLAGKLWVACGVFPFSEGGGLKQDYMGGFSWVDLHVFFPQLNSVYRFERSITSGPRPDLASFPFTWGILSLLNMHKTRLLFSCPQSLLAIQLDGPYAPSGVFKESLHWS